MRIPWQRKTESHYKTVLLALLAGAGAGLAVGMLLAPKSGDSLRADIGDAVDDYMSTAKQKAGHLRTSASNLAQRGLREIRRTKDAAGEKFSGVSEAVDNTVAGMNGATKRA